MHRGWYCKLIVRLIAKIIQHSRIDPYLHWKIFLAWNVAMKMMTKTYLMHQSQNLVMVIYQREAESFNECHSNIHNAPNDIETWKGWQQYYCGGGPTTAVNANRSQTTLACTLHKHWARASDNKTCAWSGDTTITDLSIVAYWMWRSHLEHLGM